jgi:excisionase family DNA binding protein
MAYDDKEALSVEECAKATGISRAEIYIHIGSGELASIKLGRRRLVRRQSLQDWLISLEQRTASNDDIHHRDRAKASKARGKRGQEK